MRKLIISESEKNEILNLHKKKQQSFYLKEQDEDLETSYVVMKLIDAGFESATHISNGNTNTNNNIWIKKRVDLVLDNELHQADVEVYLDDSLEKLIDLVLSDFGSGIKMEFKVTNKILEDLTNDDRMKELFSNITELMRMNADLYFEIYDKLEMYKNENLNNEISAYLNLPRNDSFHNNINLNDLPILSNKKSEELYDMIYRKIEDENIKNKLSEMISICEIINSKI
jgi:hypothetical protein